MSDYYEINENLILNVRKFYNIDKKTIDENIKILREWLKKLSHLPQDIDDEFLERILLRNKFRIEQTKLKLETYFTLRGINNEFYKLFNNIEPINQVLFYGTLPKLTPQFERIILIKLNNKNVNDYEPLTAFILSLMMTELNINYDYSIGTIYLFDFDGFTLGHLKKVTPTFLSNAYHLYEGAYSGRVKGIHYINSPSTISHLLNLIKTIIKPKLFSKVKMHPTLDSLYNSIPKQCLPKDYGGDLNDSDVIKENLQKLFNDNRIFFEKNLKFITDEKLRLHCNNYAKDKITNQLFGIDGTFKKINLD